VYFVQGSLDGPGDVDFAGEWLGFTGKENMLMFGSSYPHWQLNDPAVIARSRSPEQRDRVLWRNASEIYGIEVPAAAASR
jgi:predicted TIM-barrel fold metal-dependent hydrolase